MASFDEKIKHSRRRKDHIVKDLRTPKYREKSIPAKLREDEDERRFRRYHTLDDVFLQEGWHPLDEKDDD